MSQQQTIYEVIGGGEKIKEIVDIFYHHMDTLPEVSDIRLQHEPDLSSANEKLRLFLTGWLGGPQLYVEKYGHPRLRARHLPFRIGVKERDQWMLCMRKALKDAQVDENVYLVLEHSLFKLADHMRNQTEDT